jgi:hypothetical protein
MAWGEQKIKTNGPEAVSIEAVGNKQPHIQMDIALGVSSNPDDGAGAFEIEQCLQDFPFKGSKP